PRAGASTRDEALEGRSLHAHRNLHAGRSPRGAGAGLARSFDRPECPQALTGSLEDRLQIAAMSRSTSAWVAAAAVGPPPPPRRTLMPASSAMIAPPA